MRKSCTISLLIMMCFILYPFVECDAMGQISVSEEIQPYSFHQFVTLGAIRFYQKFISPVRGIPCPMHPHCSLYSTLAFQRYNPIKAALMTSDRLLRCGRDLENYEYVVDYPQEGFNDFPDNMPANIFLHHEWQHKVIHRVAASKNAEFMTESNERCNEEECLFRYAETLWKERDYEQAVTEYRRLLSYFPNSLYQTKARDRILESYYSAGDFSETVKWGRFLLKQKNMELESKAKINFLIGVSHLQLTNFPIARIYLTDQTITDSETEFKEKGLLLTGFSYAIEHKWEEASQVFQQISNDSPFAKNARKSLTLSQKGERLRLKKPIVAGFLSIIPGLGYLYDGYPQTALSSFFVNGLFAWGTIEAFKSENAGLGIVLSLFSVSWYSGNIYGSIKSAKRQNSKMARDVLLQFNLGFDF